MFATQVNINILFKFFEKIKLRNSIISFDSRFVMTSVITQVLKERNKVFLLMTSFFIKFENVI